jgi:hypothetical protein
MRNWKTSPLLLAAMAACAAGQNVTLLQDVGVAQAEYHDAMEAWLHNDRDLEKELLAGDPEPMRRRVRKAAALRDDAMAKKQAYLDLMIQRLRDTRARLAPADAGAIPVAGIKKDLEAQQARILGDQERLNEVLLDLPAGDEYFLVRRALEAERASLVNVQNTVALRIHSLDRIGTAQEAIRGASRGETEMQQLDQILNIWNEERTAVVRQRSSWANLYQTMENAVESRGGDRKRGTVAPGSKTTPAKKPAAGSGKQPGAAVATPAGGGVDLAGAWVYRSQPGAWTGYGEPEMVTLELHPEGAVLRGTYTARLPVRGGAHTLLLALSGPRVEGNAARLQWTSQMPAAEGAMELKLGADGRLLVERIRSGDGYIPLGMEVLAVR